jgi:hypothetical protein
MNEDKPCVGCGKMLPMDNCDGDVRNGVTYGYLGSSEGFKCEGCDEWSHFACGNRTERRCVACQSEAVA